MRGSATDLREKARRARQKANAGCQKASSAWARTGDRHQKRYRVPVSEGHLSEKSSEVAVSRPMGACHQFWDRSDLSVKASNGAGSDANCDTGRKHEAQ